MLNRQIPTVRVADIQDKKEFDHLWRICFGDSGPFCEWFFEHRFLPEYSVVLESDEQICSCMQAYPYTIHIRGKEIPGAMLCGVSTHPEHRKKGYMGKIFSHEMNHLYQEEIVVTPHTPAELTSYFSFGHFPVADATYLKCNVIPLLNLSENICMISKTNWKKLYPIYKKFAMQYSGIIQRTESDFLLKAADYAADGGKALAYIENNEIKAYAFYYQTEEQLLCVEAVALDDYWRQLIDGLLAMGTGFSFSVKLPPEIHLSYPFATEETVQKGVMGVCNMKALLHFLKLEIPYGFRVIDPIIAENNGFFDFRGNLYEGSPVFEISAGNMLQVLVGYHSLNELQTEIKIIDYNKFSEIDQLLPKQKCYIIDEY